MRQTIDPPSLVRNFSLNYLHMPGMERGTSKRPTMHSAV